MSELEDGYSRAVKSDGMTVNLKSDGMTANLRAHHDPPACRERNGIQDFSRFVP